MEGVSNAADWKRRGEAQALETAERLELPSGATILARRPGPEQLAMWGRLPAVPGGQVEGLSAEDAAELARFMRDVLVYACVKPRVSLNPREGAEEIHPRDIPDEDTRFILRWAMRAEEARALSGFRGERGDAGGGGDGEHVRRAAVVALGDRGPGDRAGRGPGGGEEAG